MSVDSVEVVRRTDGPVHTWFGLSYSNYAVLPRALMQSMPVEWQQRMVGCLRELGEAFRYVEQAPGYHVQACKWSYLDDLSDADMTNLGITSEGWDSGPNAEIVYYDKHGYELDRGTPNTAVPVADPVPHYNRGRTFVEPRETPTS